jgi:FAD/FMN-containing dehydrogenase
MNIMKIQSNEKITNLKDKVKGEIVLPGDPKYNEVRKIWNAMIDRRPAIIMQCAEADDVPHEISYARDNGLEISVRGGGHNIAGSALCNNGAMIDFSKMTAVKVDAQKKGGETGGDRDVHKYINNQSISDNTGL